MDYREQKLEDKIKGRIKFYKQNVIEIKEEIDKRQQYTLEWEHSIDSLKFVKEKIKLLKWLLL